MRTEAQIKKEDDYKNINPKTEVRQLIAKAKESKNEYDLLRARIYYLTDIRSEEKRMKGSWADYREAVRMIENYINEKKRTRDEHSSKLRNNGIYTIYKDF